jgi:hypothetical protein
MYRVIPILQISTGAPYPFPEIISGATYPGVPHAVVAKLSLGKNLASPKSEILITAHSSLVS